MARDTEYFWCLFPIHVSSSVNRLGTYLSIIQSYLFLMLSFDGSFYILDAKWSLIFDVTTANVWGHHKLCPDKTAHLTDKC